MRNKNKNYNLSLEELRGYPIGETKRRLEFEKEFYINYDRSMEGYIKLSSFIKPVNKFIIEHPDFKLNNYHLEENKIIYVDGILPLSCLRLKKNSSESMNYLSRIIS